MRKIALVILSIFSACFCIAQRTPKMDSILSQKKDYMGIVIDLRENFTEKVLQYAIDKEDNNLIKVKFYNAICWKNFGSDPQKAMNYAQKQMELAESIHDKDAMEVGYDNFGFLFKNIGDYEKSISYLLKSLKLKEEKKDSSGISVCLNGIGGLYYKMNRYPEALTYMLRTFKLDSALGNVDQVIIHYGNIGACYGNIGQDDRALFCYLRAEHLGDSLGYKPSSINLSNTGSVYLKRLQFEKAQQYFLKALKIAQIENDIASLCAVYNLLARLELLKKSYLEAIKYGEAAISLAEKNNMKEEVLQGSITLAEIYSQMGKFEKAYGYQKKYSDVKDSLLTESNARAITEMSTKYETEKKEKENKILKQTVDIQDLNANRQRIILYSVSLLSVLLVTLAFFIYRSYRQKHAANEQLAQKNMVIQEKSIIVEEQNKDIKDSIRYAKRIQEAILSSHDKFAKLFPDSFILFKPKDIVSGDFYWFDQFGDKALFAAADCTGHGVPGAFMSILGFNLLNQAVNEYALTQPNVILNSVNKGLTKALHQKQDGTIVHDGMDIALCCIDLKKNTLHYSGAYNPVWLIRNGELIEFVGDKFPIGEFLGGSDKIFTNHEMQLQKGDCVYVFTDGYADQFGGPKGKKFRYKQMLELMIKANDRSMKAQCEILDKANEDWKGNLEQVDDILIIGVKI